MPRYEIKKGDWINANNGLVLGPVLLVGVEGSDLPATWIGLTCTRSEYERLEARLPRQQRQVWTQRLHAAFWRFAVAWVEQGLDASVLELLDRQQNRDLTLDELEVILASVGRKSCSYQTRAGRDVFCTASRGAGGQVTTTSLCLSCDLPDEESLCSALMAPIAKFRYDSAQPAVMLHALCDLGQPAVQQPRDCNPGGAACWFRLYEPLAPMPDKAIDPRGLPEALDFLDATWRLAFNSRVLQLLSAESVAALVRPCETREDFKSAVSCLDDLLKLMTVADDLLTVEQRESESLKGNKTLNRLEACVTNKLAAENIGEAVGYIKTLRNVNKVRQASQHSGASSALGPALAALGVGDPVRAWGTAWDQVRRSTIHALSGLRRSLRPLAEK